MERSVETWKKWKKDIPTKVCVCMYVCMGNEMKPVEICLNTKQKKNIAILCVSPFLYP